MADDQESFEERFKRLVALGKEYESVLGDMLAQQQNTIKQAEERIGQIQSLPHPRSREKEESVYGWAGMPKETADDRSTTRRDISGRIDEKRIERLLMHIHLTPKEAKDMIALVISRVYPAPAEAGKP